MARHKDTPRIAALTEALTSGALTSRFTDQDCQAFDTFALARTRRYPMLLDGQHKECEAFVDPADPHESAQDAPQAARCPLLFQVRDGGRALTGCWPSAGWMLMISSALG